MKNVTAGRLMAVMLAAALLFLGAPFADALAQVSLAIEPQNGGIGTQVSVYGDGFEKNTTYDIYFSSQDAAVATVRHIGIDITRYKKVLTASTTSFPIFNAAFIVPQALVTAAGGEYEIFHDGDYYIYVTQAEDTLILAKAIFKMTGFASVEIDPASGNVGDGVIVTGKGYVPGETISISYDNIEITSALVGGNTTVDSSGGFTLTLTVPGSIYGPHQIKITGSRTAPILKQYNVIPEIKLNKTSAQAGETVSITGSGFGGARSVIFSLGGATVPVEWVLQDSGRTDENGRFVVNLIVPVMSAGEYKLIAGDASSSQVTAEKTFTVLPPPLNPKVELGQVNGKVGDTMNISGIEFNPSSPITLAIGGKEVEPENAITTSESGTFSASFKIPVLPAGLHTVKASDGIVEAGAGFSIVRVMEVTPLSGRAGDVISVTGNGLEADIAVVVYFDGIPRATTPVGARTGEDGTINFAFTVPACPPGNHNLEIRMGMLTLVETFTTAAEVSLGESVTAVSRQVMVNARGFAPNAPMILSLNGIQAPAVTTDANGSVDIAYVVPHVPDGIYALNIEAGGVVISKSITIIAQVGISPVEGPVGNSVNLNGSGFWPGKIIVVLWGGKAVPGFSTPVVASDGSFSAVFDVPVTAPGEYIISVSDGVISKEKTFSVEQTVPSSPVPVTPPGGIKISGHPYFEWGAVIYPYMDVTYEFQIIRNLTEPELVIEKPGLKENSYKLDKNEELEKAGPDNPYYWRVRAIDEAGNTSQWSEASEFYYGFIWPSWLTWVLVGAGVFLVIVVVYIFRWRIADLF